MKFTIKDLKEGKVILLNDNEKYCKKVLKKAFGITMESYEVPGSLYYHGGPNNPKMGYHDGCYAFDIIERDAKHIIDLPVQKAIKFKI